MVDNQAPEVVQPIASSAPAVLAQEMSIEQVIARVEKVRELQRRVMKEGVHYGTIPGTPKPTLYKAGAELMLLTFMLDPQYEHTVQQDGKHREILSRCILHHIPSGNRVGSGQGSCSTYESKYAYRKAAIQCPRCNKELRRSKTEWYCWRKQGGCGGTYPLGQFKEVGRVENPDIADQYNTVLKMANKRSLVAGILNVTAASEIFTQDLEDFDENVGEARSGNVTGAGQPDAVSSSFVHEERSDDALSQVPASSQFSGAHDASGPEPLRDTRSSTTAGARGRKDQFANPPDMLSEDVEADGKPGVGEQDKQEGPAPDALADAAEKAMINEMWKRCKAPFPKKLAALQAVGFTTIEELRKSQVEGCTEALQGLWAIAL